MVRLAKFLKPYILLTILAIGLLFIQANADLALPDYMSNIINVGIQQGGIASAVPQAIRESEMNKLILFMSDADKTFVLNDYTLIAQSSADYAKYLKLYPQLAKEPVYVLNSINQTEIDKLNPIIGKSFLVIKTIDQIMADPSKLSTIGQSLGFDASKITANTDIYTLMAKMPAAALAQMKSGLDSKTTGLSDSTIIQSAAPFIRAEYAALGMDTGKVQTMYILRIGGWMILLTLLSITCAIAVGFLAARIAAGVARDIRHGLFRKVESFSKTEFDKFSTASLITRTTNDVTQIQMVIIMLVRMVVYAPIIGIGAIIHAVGKSSSMSWLIGLAVVVLLGMILTIFSIALPKFKIIQSLIDRLNLVTRENLSGMMVIRAFNKQAFEEDRFDKANHDLTDNNLFVNRIMVIMMPMMMLIMNGLSLLIIWVGAHQVAQSAMQVGDMMAFMQYAMQVVMAFLMLSIMFIILPRASVSAGRIADVLDTKLEIVDPVEPKQFPANVQGRVVFDHVSFRYPDAEEDVLHDINFIAMPGQTTAIIGPTGSGKSSVVNLIPRFYDVTSGAIRVDGIDIRDVKQSDLRDQIGYIPQKGTLFSGSIESNLRYADENTSQANLEEAASVAQANEFISTMPDGMQTEISQGGTNVSGGQKQRLSIARALVKQAPIYIFDDSFSALDFKTDSALRKALKISTGRSTVLIVTQRISTIKTAEQIIVVDDGRIVGKGTHKELMATCETYREIALSQLSKEELS